MRFYGREQDFTGENVRRTGENKETRISRKPQFKFTFLYTIYNIYIYIIYIHNICNFQISRN